MNKKKKENDPKHFSFLDKLAVRMYVPEYYNQIVPQEKKEKEKQTKTGLGTIFNFGTKYKDKEIEMIDNDGSLFCNVIGYDDIKKIFVNLFESSNGEIPVSVLLSGSAGCGKSLFLKEIERAFPNESYYIDGSRATKAGIFEVLFNDYHNSIKYLLIDELDKLSMGDQESLLTLIQDGKLVQTLKTSTRSKSYNSLSVIGASNHIDSILQPLKTRFFVIGIADYTPKQFRDISLSILQNKYNIEIELAEYITDRVMTLTQKPNIRDCEQIAKLCKNNVDMVDLLLENKLRLEKEE